MKNSNRTLLFILICVLLCAMFTLSASANETGDGSLGDAIGDAVGDAVNGAVNDAVNDAIGDITGDINEGLGNITLPETLGSVLEIQSVEDANAFFGAFEPTLLFIIAACCIVIALFGLRLLKFALALIGFMGGWAVGNFLFGVAVDIKIVDAANMEPYVPYIVYAVCGIIFALIAFRLLKFGIFLGVAASVFLVLAGVGVFNQLVDSIITSEGDIKYILARLLVAVIVGLLANVFTDPILILTTSALGGMTGGISLMVAIGQTGDTTVETVVGLALTVIGIIVQFRMGRKKKK